MNALLEAYKIFSAGLHSMNWYWVLWVYLMITVNGLLPLLFLPKFTSIIVLSAGLTGFMIGLILTHAMGYSKILGLMHFPWIPMVCFQIYYFQKQGFSINGVHDYWFFLSLMISSISLIIDLNDIYSFLQTS